MEERRTRRDQRSAGVSKKLRMGALALLFVLAPNTADGALSKHGSSEVRFDATATGGMKIRGKTSELRLSEQGPTVRVTVPLASLRTGIALRDKHMREKYLRVDEHPEAELRVDRAALEFPKDGSTLTKTVGGRFTLHGQTTPSVFRYTARRDGDVYRVAGALRVDMTKHGIEQPSFMGVTVDSEVTVSVRFEAKDVP
jgi:polyisoprenoid-binding protein YceI